ncbi:MAG: hypothetical protein ACTSYC_07175 [Promethearchaeota archaeon]
MEEKKKLMERKLRDKLYFEENNYFFICNQCENKTIKYNFDDAYELNFRCPECGGTLEAQDNKDIIEFLKKRILICEKMEININEA